MKCNQAGIDLIKEFEGFRAEPYQCSAGVWTIGYGATRDIDGNAIAEDSPSVAIDEAEHLLKRDIEGAERGVNALLEIEVTDNQFSALVSLAYNIGNGAFGRSNVLKCLNAGDFEQMKIEWREWRKALGQIVEGLVLRRAAELALFLKGQS